MPVESRAGVAVLMRVGRAGILRRIVRSQAPLPRHRPRMRDRQDPEALFLEQLGWIEKVAAIACRRNGVWDAEAEDFASLAKMKLMEDDYAVFRKFRGESEIRTFIATVVQRHFQAYARERRGRWRPSALAERLGPPAPELESLVYRDGYAISQAGERLRTAGRTALTDAELARLLDRLPRRAPLRPREVADDPALDAAPGPFRADERIAAAQAQARRREVLDALERALDGLEPEDRLVVLMRFRDGYTLADVARALKLEQRPLYRRVARLQAVLRERLERAGIGPGDVGALLAARGDEEEE